MKAKTIILAATLTAAALCLAACQGEQPPSGRGSRLLGVDISQHGQASYDAALAKVKSIGAQVIDLHLNWDMLEGEQGDYSSLSGFGFLDSYYQDMDVALTIGVIDTNSLAVPPYIEALGDDFPAMAEAFKDLLDAVIAAFPNMRISVLSIGNEVDVYLGDDAEKWADWTAFYQDVLAYAASKKTGARQDMIIGTKTTVKGALGAAGGYIAGINGLSVTDGVLLTYYPLNDDFTVKPLSVIADDLAALAGIFAKRLYLVEAGYPSGALCQSSASKQAQFVHEIFTAWDRYQDKIPVVIFSWLNDLNEEKVAEFETKYGISDSIFLEHLCTLGLVTYDGVEKPAWGQLVAETEARDWTAL